MILHKTQKIKTCQRQFKITQINFNQSFHLEISFWRDYWNNIGFFANLGVDNFVCKEGDVPSHLRRYQIRTKLTNKQIQTSSNAKYPSQFIHFEYFIFFTANWMQRNFQGSSARSNDLLLSFTERCVLITFRYWIVVSNVGRLRNSNQTTSFCDNAPLSLAS